MMGHRNPTEIVVATPDKTETVQDVRTWWRDGADLVVEYFSGDEGRFPLGEIIRK